MCAEVSPEVWVWSARRGAAASSPALPSNSASEPQSPTAAKKPSCWFDFEFAIAKRPTIQISILRTLRFCGNLGPGRNAKILKDPGLADSTQGFSIWPIKGGIAPGTSSPQRLPRSRALVALLRLRTGLITCSIPPSKKYYRAQPVLVHLLKQ